MAAINTHMNMILELFSEEITWQNLHVLDRETDMYKLQQIVKTVRNITAQSNKEANELDNE